MIGPAVAVLLPLLFWPLGARPYDYCTPPPADHLVDRYLADPNSVVPQPLDIPKPEGAISSGQTPERVNFFGAIPDPGKSFSVVLVPVGYERGEVDGRMQELVVLLHSAFERVENLRFGYAYPSVDISVGRIERLLVPDVGQIEQFKKVMDAQGADVLVFVINSQEYLGAAFGNYVVVAGQAPHQPIVHETGHLLGLGDGYDRYYGADDLAGTELFLNVKSLLSYTAQAYRQVHPAIEVAGVCGTRTVYRFAGSRDTLMAYGQTLSSMQIAVMQQFIRHVLDEKHKHRK